MTDVQLSKIFEPFFSQIRPSVFDNIHHIILADYTVTIICPSSGFENT